MVQVIRRSASFVVPIILCSCSGGVFNVRDFGAKGDGISIDSPAINAAIEAAMLTEDVRNLEHD